MTTETTTGGIGNDEGLRLRMRGEERRIASQHEKLDVLCREIYALLDKDGPRAAVNDFLLFHQVLEAHMTVEEEIYFPAFHGLRPDLSEELDQLIVEHDELRGGLGALKQALKASETDRARFELERLARRIEEHEAAEEDMIVRINDGPLLETGGLA